MGLVPLSILESGEERRTERGLVAVNGLGL